MRHVHRAVGVALAAALLLAGPACQGLKSTSPEAQPTPTAEGLTTAPKPTTSPLSPPPSPAPTVTVTAQSTQPALANDPAAVVAAYYAAINRHDYERAWRLGGKNFDDSYRQFVEGFAETRRDLVTVVDTQRDTAQVLLLAQQTDGSVRAYKGTYTARDGVLVDAALNTTTIPSRSPTPAAPIPQPHAICADGTVSYSVHRQGTCSWHGGVKKWLRP